MSDTPDIPDPDPFAEPAAADQGSDPEAGPYPWDDPPPDDPGALSSDLSSEALAKEEALAQEGPRQRHDEFTEARKAAYLTTLVKTGCILDACRLTGVSSRTIYRHQEKDQRFRDHCEVALRMSATPVELTAWQRAVEGVEHEFACGGQVYVRRRYSDGLLRLLLQGSNPKKYGPNPGFKRKRLLKYEKKQMEREVRAELAAKQKRWTFDEAIMELGRRLEMADLDGLMARHSPGWTRTEDGHWIPPGYGWVGLPEGSDGEGEGGPGAETPRDSV